MDRASHVCVFGLSFGDEGKGKVVDLLGPAFDIVVRYNGGANAGHTVCVGEKKFALHLLPTGLLRAGVLGVIGPGVVADPLKLVEEIDALTEQGIDVTGRLKISDRAHLVLDYHKLEDQLGENLAREGKRIGTTARGIGPCYAEKMRRHEAIRFCDLAQPGDAGEVFERVRGIAQRRRDRLVTRFKEDGGLNVDALIGNLQRARERLLPFICDTTSLLLDAMDAGKRVLFEGANGIFLDIDHGTFPFVTSSSTGPHGIGPGAGVPPRLVPTIIGITKAYATRVGEGPFVSELEGETADRIRIAGNEFGTTTGRPRRCGWFDAVATRYAVRLTGTTNVAMMHLDTLSGFDAVGVCTAYRLGSETLSAPPAHAPMLEACEPVIEMLPGWSDNLRNVRSYEDLPDTARAYVERVEQLVGAPLSILGVGPDREQTILRGPMQSIVPSAVPSAV